MKNLKTNQTNNQTKWKHKTRVLNFNTDETAEERENQKKQLIQFLKENDSVDPLQAWLKARYLQA